MRRYFPLFLSLGLLFLLASCSSDALRKSENPEVVYNEGARLLEKGNYIEASEFFTEVKKRFPQSKYFALAQLRSADLEYNQDNFAEAAAAYGVFFDLYPRHPEAPYALFRRAISFFKDSPDLIARDQTPAKQAVDVCRQFLNRFPSSTYTPEVTDTLNKSRLKMAEKEAYIARFYERREANVAAVRRWNIVKNDFSDIKNLPEASALFQEADTKLSKLEQSSANSN